MICADHTNAQIATKLFISAKTVDHHVSAVLAKLDARTRDVAASHAARLGLVGAAEDRQHRRKIWVTTTDPGRGPAAIRSP